MELASAERLATSPQDLLKVLYIIFAALIVVALVLATQLEMKRHHLPRFAAAAFLLVAMSGLLVAADYLIFTDPIVTESLAQATLP